MNGKLVEKMANLLCVLCIAAIVCCACPGCGVKEKKAAPAKAVAAPAKAVAAPEKAVAAPEKAVAAPEKAVAASTKEVAAPEKEVATAAAEEATLAKAAATLENLMKSYDGECNANVRYVLFAKKADEDGYGQVASLFRAAAAAEQIHFVAQAAVIKKLGGTANANIKAPEVKSTKENLEAAVKGESDERDTLYPEFIKAAEADKIDDAVEVFNEAKSAEAAHAKLYEEALGDLDSWKAGKKDFFVCPECGNTVVELTFEECPVCETPKDKFTKIN